MEEGKLAKWVKAEGEDVCLGDVKIETDKATMEVEAIDREIRAIVNEAAGFATHNPEPDAAELYTDVLR